MFAHLLHGAQDQRLGAEQGQFPCGSTGTSSSSGQETETHIVLYVARRGSLSQTTLQGTMEVGKAVVGKGNAG